MPPNTESEHKRQVVDKLPKRFKGLKFGIQYVLPVRGPINGAP